MNNITYELLTKEGFTPTITVDNTPSLVSNNMEISLYKEYDDGSEVTVNFVLCWSFDGKKISNHGEVTYKETLIKVIDEMHSYWKEIYPESLEDIQTYINISTRKEAA